MVQKMVCYKKWCVIKIQAAKDKYNQYSSIKFETKTIKSSLCDYFDSFIVVTGDITVTANSDTDVAFKNCAPITVPSKHFSNFWRSLEMPLINCKIHLELNWIEHCILSCARDSGKFKIANAKLHFL